MIKGIGASPGIALAKALIVKNDEITINRKTISNIDEEINKFKESIVLSKNDLLLRKSENLKLKYLKCTSCYLKMIV